MTLLFDGENFSVEVSRRWIRGRSQEFEVVRRPPVVLGIPVSIHDGEYFLVRQQRAAMSSPTLEFPAGRVEAGEDLASALRREMLEELGFECERVTELGQLLTAPHFSDEVVHCFVVKGAVRSQVAPTPKEEILEGMKVASRDLLRMISTGQIMDGKTLSAIAMLVAEGLLP